MDYLIRRISKPPGTFMMRSLVSTSRYSTGHSMPVEVLYDNKKILVRVYQYMGRGDQKYSWTGQKFTETFFSDFFRFLQRNFPQLKYAKNVPVSN